MHNLSHTKKYIFMVYIEATVANKYKQNIMYIFNFMGQIILLAPQKIIWSWKNQVYLTHTLADSGGGGAREARSPRPNCFIFIQFSAKNLQNNTLAHTLGVGAPSEKSWIHHCHRIENVNVYIIFCGSDNILPAPQEA